MEHIAEHAGDGGHADLHLRPVNAEGPDEDDLGRDPPPRFSGEPWVLNLASSGLFLSTILIAKALGEMLPSDVNHPGFAGDPNS